MAKPVLLSVDDDRDVLRAIERDLRSQYGGDFRVIGSDSPEGALDLLKQLKLRNDSVALLLADQRMPNMDGVGFLLEGMRIFPDAKRALLTAYADTNAAISASGTTINCHQCASTNRGPREYASFEADVSTLERAAAATGGAVDPPTVAAVFDPGGEKVTFHEELWRRFIYAAIVVFLLDLFVRRVRLFDRKFIPRRGRIAGNRAQV